MKKLFGQIKGKFPAVLTILATMIIINRAKAGSFGGQAQSVSQKYLSIS